MQCHSIRERERERERDVMKLLCHGADPSHLILSILADSRDIHQKVIYALPKKRIVYRSILACETSIPLTSRTCTIVTSIPLSVYILS
jgi:hypothetical protein